jgi:cell division protein ZapA (FtsZ GTPase activity inhibitor)
VGCDFTVRCPDELRASLRALAARLERAVSLP